MSGLDLLILVVKVVAVLSVVLGLATLMTWVERKQSAIMQDRLGANRADILGLRIIGLFQPFADAIKMITKEDFAPPFANRTLHLIAPAVAFFAVLTVFAAIPWGPPIRIAGKEITLQIASLDIGLLYIIGFSGLAIYGAVLGGWSSNNKYALLGSLRATAQMISYEVCLGLSLLGAVMVYGTLDLMKMVEFQSYHWGGWLPRWGIFLQPLAVFLFLPAAIAENKRIPFDLPEAESEIVGYYTEYSGLRAGLFMMAEFIEMILISVLFTLIFLGGWSVPWLYEDGFHFPWGGVWVLPYGLVKLVEVGAMFFKIALVIYFLELVRWTLPRFRYDQVMRLGWVYLFPLGLLNLALTGMVLMLVRGVS